MKEHEITIRTWKFEEASEELKAKILERHCDFNVCHEWWLSVYDDAENVGIKIKSFDIDRGSYVDAGFVDGAEETANKIVSEHGEHCDTFTTAQNYLTDRDALVVKYSDGVDKDRVHEDFEWEFDQECDRLDDDFLSAIQEDYRIILQKEYEYLTSEEAIKESLIANGYDFTEDGKIY